MFSIAFPSTLARFWIGSNPCFWSYYLFIVLVCKPGFIYEKGPYWQDGAPRRGKTQENLRKKICYSSSWRLQQRKKTWGNSGAGVSYIPSQGGHSHASPKVQKEKIQPSVSNLWLSTSGQQWERSVVQITEILRSREYEKDNSGTKQHQW